MRWILGRMCGCLTTFIPENYEFQHRSATHVKNHGIAVNAKINGFRVNSVVICDLGLHIALITRFTGTQTVRTDYCDVLRKDAVMLKSLLKLLSRAKLGPARSEPQPRG